MLRKRLLNSQSSEPYIGVYKVVNTINVPYTGDSKVITVLSTGPFTIFANEHSDEITVSPSTIETAGENQVRITSSSSTSTSSISDIITIRPTGTDGSKDFDINWTREGAPLTYSITPSSISAPYTGGTYNINFITNDSTYYWIADASERWLRLSPSSGTGTTSLNVTVSQNGTPNSRTGTISFFNSDREELGTVEITQEGNTTIKWTVNAVSNPAGEGTITGTGSFSPGTSTTLTVTDTSENNEYIFEGWYNASDSSYSNKLSSNKSYTISNITKDYNLVARFVQISSIVVDFVATQRDSHTVSTAWGTISNTSHGSDVTVTTITGGFRATLSNISGSNSIYLYANPAKSRGFTRWYTSAYGTLSSSVSLIHGIEAKHITTLTKSGNNWIGKYTVEAQFSETSVQFTITVQAGANGQVKADQLHNWSSTNDSVQAYQYSFQTIYAQGNDGYRFVQWNDGDTSAQRSVYVDGNATYTATFGPSTYSVSGPASLSYNQTGNITGNYNGTTEYTFSDVSIESEEDVSQYVTITTSANSTTITNNNTSGHTIEISVSCTNHGLQDYFTCTLLSQGQVSYTVSTSVSPSGVGVVNGGGTYSSGANVLLTATPTNNNYVFSNWSGSISGSTNPYTITNLNSNKSVTAVFTIPSYNITVQSDSGNHCSVGINGSTLSNYQSVSINKGNTFILSATPESGYTFQYFSGSDGNNYNADVLYTVSSNLTLTAVVIEDGTTTYTVNVNTDNSSANNKIRINRYSSGWKLSDSVIVEENTSLTLMVSVGEGYLFDGWYVNNSKVSSSTSYTVNINSNITYTAKFTEEKYTVQLILKNGQTIPANAYTLSGGGSNLSLNANLNLSAAVNSGYTNSWEFDHFEIYNAETEEYEMYEDNPLSISVSSLYASQYGAYGNTFTVYALFSPIQQVETVNVTITTNNNNSACTAYINGTAASFGTPFTVEKNTVVNVSISVTNSNVKDLVRIESGGSTVTTNTTYSFVASSDTTLTCIFSDVTWTLTLNNDDTEYMYSCENLYVSKNCTMHKFLGGTEVDTISIAGSNASAAISGSISGDITMTNSGNNAKLYVEDVYNVNKSITFTVTATYSGITRSASKTVTVYRGYEIIVDIGNYDYPEGSQTDITEYGNLSISSTNPSISESGLKTATIYVAPISNIEVSISTISPSYLVEWQIDGESVAASSYIEFNGIDHNVNVVAMLKDPLAI